MVRYPLNGLNGLLTPIPKSDTQDARNSLSYRGISLLSLPYKIYADILNQRLTKWLEENKLLVEEQNGFRKKRNCVEYNIYWTNKVRDQTFNAQFLELLVKLNISIIKVIHFVSIEHLRIETIVFAFNKTRPLKMKWYEIPIEN